MPATYEPIASTTLGSAANSVTFSSIPNTYTDLVVVVYAQSAGDGANTYLRFNGDSGTNYSDTALRGDGSSASSSRRSNIAELYGGELASNTQSPNPSIFQVFSYSSGSVFKTVLSSSGNAAIAVVPRVGLWRNTNVITSVQVATNTLNYAAGSTFSLYGIKAA